MTEKGKIFRICRLLLTIWGGISLLGTVIIISYLLYGITIGNTNKEDKASKSDVRFVLNWCGLGDQRIDQVLRSHTSARSFTGDHLDAYAIKITNVTLDELKNKNEFRTGQWYSMDSLPPILDEAISFVSRWEEEIPWFPTECSLRTADFFVYPWSIYCHGVSPTSAQLIFIKPEDKTVYYINIKM